MNRKTFGNRDARRWEIKSCTEYRRTILCLRLARWSDSQRWSYTVSVCGDRFGNQYSWCAFRPGHRITQIYGCASIMSRPAATAGRENNDEPVGPTPALIYLRFLARMQQICFCRVSSTLSTLEECNHIREESFVCHFNAFRRGRETNLRLQLDVPR